MESISVREVFRKAACQVGSGEDLVWGDLDSTMAGMTKVLLEVMAESEVERRVGVRLHERGESRSDYRNGYRRRMVQLSYQVVEIRIPRLRRWCARWRQKYPGVVASVEQDAGRLLAFFACPELHWEYVRTSNPIERVFLELRRQQFGCGAFANRDACNRAVYRVFSWLNDLWSGKDIWQPRLRKRKQIALAA